MAKKKKDPNKKGFFAGFKDFIARGNVIDMAIGVIVGGAFGAIVTSFVNDMLMPLIAAIFGSEKGLEQLYWVIRGNAPDSPEVVAGAPIGNVMYYGRFIQTIINFLVVAFFIYLILVVIIQGAQKRSAEKKAAEEAALKAAEEAEKEPEPEPEPVIPEDIKLLTEIRDQLEKLNEDGK